MAESLSPAQTETFQALQSMGFDDAACVSAAETFGQNVQGAINYLLSTSSISGVAAPTSTQSPYSHNTEPQPPAESVEESYEWHPSLFSNLLTAGYIRLQFVRENTTIDIPDGIQKIITTFTSFLFVKLRFDINDETQKYDELRVLQKNWTCRDLLLWMEQQEPVSPPENKDNSLPIQVAGYPTYCCFWMRFFALKPIYPIDKKMVVTMEQIDESNENPNRWVELPADYEKTKLSDIVEALDDSSYVLELAVEKFDVVTGTWPFRGDNAMNSGGDDDNKAEQEDDVAWRYNLRIGDFVDAHDDQDKWYESVVRYVEFESGATPNSKRFPDDADPSEIEEWKTLETAIVNQMVVVEWISIETIAHRLAEKRFVMEDVKQSITKFAPYSSMLEFDAQENNIRRTRTRCFAYIHYIGWNVKWDERIEVLDARIARRGTHSRGAHKPRRLHLNRWRFQEQ